MNNKNGFTLIEVIIVITILSLIISALAGLFESSMVFWNRVNNQTELQHNLRFALNKIISDIRSSKRISSSSNANEIVLFISDTETIKYGLKNDNMSSEHPYHIIGKVLYREVNGGNQDPIANFIQKLSFAYNDADPAKATFVTVTIEGALLNNKIIVFKSGAEVKWQSFGSLIE